MTSVQWVGLAVDGLPRVDHRGNGVLGGTSHRTPLPVQGGQGCSQASWALRQRRTQPHDPLRSRPQRCETPFLIGHGRFLSIVQLMSTIARGRPVACGWGEAGLGCCMVRGTDVMRVSVPLSTVLCVDQAMVPEPTLTGAF